MRASQFLPLVLLACLRCSNPEDVVATYPTYKHERPSWSTDGLTVAFRAEINGVLGMYAVDSTGMNLRLVHSGDAIGYTWSPDAKRIAYSELGNLFTVKPNGDSIVQLSSALRDIRPAWSRDGKMLAFFRRPVDGGVFALRLDSLTSTRVDPQGNYPSWDNVNRIVTISWTYFSFDDRFQNYLTAYRVDSVNSSQISSFYSQRECSFPQVRSDGKQVVFVMFDEMYYPQIWTIDLNTQQRQLLTADGADAPCFSPDGSKIVYTRVAPGDGGLWVMNNDGSNKHRLTTP